jgi:hypothetical protein
MLTLKLTEKEKEVLYKALNYQMVDVAFLDSFKRANHSEEKQLIERLLVKISTLN